MNVILRQDVEGLGFEFEVVSVKPGYARNFLIPRGLVSVATPKNVKELNEVLETRKASTSSLQRKFSLGYNRAARIIDQMEENGIVSAMGANGKREILV